MGLELTPRRSRVTGATKRNQPGIPNLTFVSLVSLTSFGHFSTVQPSKSHFRYLRASVSAEPTHPIFYSHHPLA